MKKLQPLVVSIGQELVETQRGPSWNPEELEAHEERFQQDWLSRSGEDWVYQHPNAPFLRTPLHLSCDGMSDRPECARDRDGDGIPAESDCDDRDANVHPGQREIPSNGRDDDCADGDAEPWNVVVILMESHRALNVGALRDVGATESSTPFWTP